MRSRILLLSALLLCLSTACGDDTPADGNTSTVPQDAGAQEDGGLIVLPDGGVILPDGGSPTTDGGTQPASRALAFNGISPQLVYYGQAQTLAFTLTNSDGAVSGADVRLTLQGSGGSLSAGSARTNAQGVAEATFVAGATDADLTLIASADLASPVAVDIEVRVDPVGSATVAVTAASSNRIPVARAEISLVVAAMGQTAPTCAALLAATEPPASSNVAVVQPLPGSKSFSALPQGSSLVAYVRGLNANGLPVAAGCAEGTRVVGGSNVSMSATLTQLPTDFTGTMDSLTKVELSGALPQPYEGYLDLFGSFVSNPTGVAVYYVLKKADDLLDSNPSLSWITLRFLNGASLENVLASPEPQFGVWRAASSYLDGLITGTSFGPTYTRIKTVGTDVNTMVRSFDVGTRMHIAKLATPDQLQINEKWQAIVYTWGYGCEAGDEGCRRHPMQMANTDYAPVNESYGAAVAYAPSATESERYQLTLEPHDIPVRYGAIILLAVNELVVPRVTNCTTCHSVTDLLVYEVDCNTVGTSLNTWIANNVPFVGAAVAGVLTPTVIEGACTSGLSLAGAYVEAKALELVANDVQQLETDPAVGSGGTLYLVDADKDVKTELLRDLHVDVAWYDPNHPALTQELDAPMTGAGRTAATDCGSDLDCVPTESCQVIPSYLQVQEVETTCQRAVGSQPGNAACTSNAQCSSGLCAAGSCFEACSDNAQCSSGVCAPDRASVDLNGVLQGLGSALAQGCMP